MRPCNCMSTENVEGQIPGCHRQLPGRAERGAESKQRQEEQVMCSHFH